MAKQKLTWKKVLNDLVRTILPVEYVKEIEIIGPENHPYSVTITAKREPFMTISKPRRK